MATKTSGRYAVRKPKTPKRSMVTQRKGPRRKSGAESMALPGWGEIKTNGHAEGRIRAGAYLEKVSTVRFALLILGIAACFTLYVGHVHATQSLLAEVQQVRKENLRLHLKHDRLKGAFDQATGPSAIYERARRLGFVESIEYEPTIRVETE